MKRISIKELLHEIYHFFTHIEKGFFYTLKQLIIAPGRMQLNYIEGKRNIHQKPFSMFLICATIAALSRYWIFTALLHYYHADTFSEATFFHDYMVIMFIVLVPIYVAITHLIFYKSGYNYAEIGIMILYTVSIFFLMASLISFLELIYPHLDTAFIELPIFTLYLTITLIHFFKTIPWWKVALKCVIIMVVAFAINRVMEDFIIELIS